MSVAFTFEKTEKFKKVKTRLKQMSFAFFARIQGERQQRQIFFISHIFLKSKIEVLILFRAGRRVFSANRKFWNLFGKNTKRLSSFRADSKLAIDPNLLSHGNPSIV